MKTEDNWFIDNLEIIPKSQGNIVAGVIQNQNRDYGSLGRLAQYSYLIRRGWGNGYVSIPADHPWYGIDYDNIPVDVHGGLTFGSMIDGKYWIGFDTAHYQDNLTEWPKERVIAETIALMIQAIDAYKKVSFVKRLINKYKNFFNDILNSL